MKNFRISQRRVQTFLGGGYCKKNNRLDKFFGVYIDIQSAITCSKLTIETLGQGVKYVQS